MTITTIQLEPMTITPSREVGGEYIGLGVVLGFIVLVLILGAKS